MEYEWSSYFQNPLHIEASRILSLNDDTRDILMKYLPLRDGMRILDVGCGNGIFTTFLGECVSGCDIMGVDIDENFIKDALRRITVGLKNNYTYLQADGFSLPFENETFDLVVSHTYLTSVSDPVKALKEKMRVAKKGGYVASVTGQSFKNQVFSLGNYPEVYMKMLLRFFELRTKVENMYRQLVHQDDFVKKEFAERIPQLFGMSGLKNISMHPLGIAFSLSDSHIPIDIKKKYITSFYDGELIKLEIYTKLNDTRIYMSQLEIDEYAKLIKEHKRYLLESLGENMVWEWFGGSNVLMVGQKPCY